MEKIDRIFIRINGSYLIFSAVIISVVSAAVSIGLYIPRDPSFSLFTHWLPTYGDTVPELPAHIFNTGVIIMSPLLIFAHLFIARFLHKRGAHRGLIFAALVSGIISSTGEIFVGLIPANVNFTGHLIAALFFFTGGILFGLFYGITEIKMPKIPNYLAVTGFIMSFFFLTFTVLLVMTQIDKSLNPDLPAIWEWLSYLSISLWGMAHGFYTLRNR